MKWEGGKWVAPPPKLPKPRCWWSHNEADADKMVAWVNEHLTVRKAERMNEMIAEVGDQWKLDPETGLATITYYKLEDMFDEAETGNMEPLRKAYPKLAKYLNPRQRGKGDYPRPPNLKAERAAEDVHFIRELWRREFGKWKRARNNPPFAEDIAAAFHKVHVDSVKSRLK